jgi:hypothetical protein
MRRGPRECSRRISQTTQVSTANTRDALTNTRLTSLARRRQPREASRDQAAEQHVRTQSHPRWRRWRRWQRVDRRWRLRFSVSRIACGKQRSRLDGRAP